MEKIAIVVKNYDVGRPSGVISLSEIWRKKLLQKGIEVRVFFSRGDSFEGGEKFSLFGFFDLVSALRTFKPDATILISSASSGFLIHLWWFYKLSIWRKKTVYYQATNTGACGVLAGKIIGYFLSGYLRVAVASYDQKDISQRFLDEVEVVLPGSESLGENATTDKKWDVVFLGHTSLSKGVDKILEMASRRPQYKFLVIAGKSRSKVDKGVHTLLAENTLHNLTFIGEKITVNDYLPKCKILILPYRSGEFVLGVAQSLIEAASLGIPCIATSNSAVTSFIEDGVNGYYATNIDDFLFNADELLSSDKKLQGVGCEARKTFLNKFTDDISINALLRVCR
ncbi:MAG: glycosyltransferase [Cellvibrionaceae bacterium]